MPKKCIGNRKWIGASFIYAGLWQFMLTKELHCLNNLQDTKGADVELV
jgi:hypothetical protein